MRRTTNGKVYVHHDKKRNRWRVETRSPGGGRSYTTCTTRHEAEELADEIRMQFETGQKSVSHAIDDYVATLRERGKSDRHVETTEYRLGIMFPRTDLFLNELTPRRAERLYADLRKRYSVDTHRNALSQTKTFCRWLVKKGALRRNPFNDVEGEGERNKGKEQLTIDESRKLLDTCLASDDVGATATLCCLLLALRANEIAKLTPRAIDDGGRIIRVFKAKTKAGVRLVEVPEVLRDRLPALVERGADRWWIHKQAKKWCEIAGVPQVGPHALRGTHASLAVQAGASSHLVAATLGHSSPAVTEAHYTKKQAQEGARQKTALRVLAGGRGN